MQVTEVLKESPQPALPAQAADEIVAQIIKIGQFSKLADNWDSEGGKAIPLKVCEKAVKYLSAAFKELSNDLPTVEKNDGGENEKEGLLNSATAFVQAVKWFSAYK